MSERVPVRQLDDGSWFIHAPRSTEPLSPNIQAALDALSETVFSTRNRVVELGDTPPDDTPWTPTPMTLERILEVVEEFEAAKPTVFIAFEDYERVSELLDREFPDTRYGWSSVVPPGQMIVVRP